MRGWLILFFVGITILVPFQALGHFTRTWLGARAETAVSYPSPNLEIEVANTFAFIGIAAFGIYTGIALIRLKPNAVRITKRYLLSRLIYAATYVVVVTFLLHSKLWDPDNYESGLLYGFGKEVISVTIWSWYFAKSERVAGTYPPSESALFK